MEKLIFYIGLYYKILAIYTATNSKYQ